MVFKGQDAVRIKTVLEKIIEKSHPCNYFGNLMSYEKEVDTDNKLNKYHI